VYNVKSGSITKEFGGDAVAANLKQSSYLPKVILKNAFEPVVLGLQIKMEKPLTVKNQQMEGQLGGDLQIKGPPNRPSLSGKINIERNTKLLFRDKVFEVSSGSVTFNNPDEINPELYIASRGRITEYDINLLVQGTAKDPQVRLTSIPPLSEQDIVSLLAFGVLSQSEKLTGSINNKNRDEDKTLAAVGSAILNNSPVGKELRDRGFSVQVSSSYDSTKDTATQVITISKSLTEKVKASASRLQGKQNSNEVQLRYEFNNNVSAIGTWEGREPIDNASVEGQRKSESILGLDLEYKREFK
jgi:translocation and assembly module TamB